MIAARQLRRATVRDGDFHGRRTRIVESAHCWVEILAEAGPRIVRFGAAGGPNVFAETPDIQWETAFGRYELLGGHRLWFAPERPELNVPDGAGLELSESIAGGGLTTVRIAGPVEPRSGLRRSVEVSLEPSGPCVRVRHRLDNEGDADHELGVWPITQVPLGGVALVPQPRRETRHGVSPNRQVVLWPYADWADDRLLLRDGLLALHARPARPFKIGCRSEAGIAAYLHAGWLFVKRFDPAPERPHPDLGCNVELYADERSCEVETVGPLVRLRPGCGVEFEERWELHRVASPEEPLDAAALLAILDGLDPAAS